MTTPVSIVQNRDCMEAMAEFPDKYFDLAIVDPPYGIGVAKMNMGLWNGKRCSKAKNRKWTAKVWDNEVAPPEYFTELFRVSKNQIIWGGNYFPLPPTQGFVIWDKQIAESLSFSQYEYAWTSYQRAAKGFDYSVYLSEGEKLLRRRLFCRNGSAFSDAHIETSFICSKRYVSI